MAYQALQLIKKQTKRFIMHYFETNKNTLALKYVHDIKFTKHSIKSITVVSPAYNQKYIMTQAYSISSILILYCI